MKEREMSPIQDPSPRSTLYRLLQKLLLSFFRAFYLFEVKGIEHVPTHGPLVITANHINLLDAMMIAACVPRRIRFVAWNHSFTLPAAGWFLRATGCIPVDREKPDPSAFKESVRWLTAGNVLGIFPEGTYTTDGHLMPIKAGTARIALAANATVVPATLTGSYRSWPSVGSHKKLLPRPWKIVLKFHPPIRTKNEQASVISDQKAAAEILTGQLTQAINQTLEPALRAEERVDRLVEQPASHIRLYEWFFCVVLLAACIVGGWEWRALLVASFYFAYLLADVYLIPQSRRTRAVRNFSPVLALAAAYPSLVRVIGPLDHAGSNRMADVFGKLPRLLAWSAIDAWFVCYGLVIPYTLWAMITYCFEKYLQFQRFIRGFLVTLYFCLLELMFFPFMRQEYPLAIDSSHRGLYARFLELVNPLHEMRLLWLPAFIVSLSAFTLAFDFAHNRKRFRTVSFFVLNSWVSAVVLRGYPLPSVLINLATVALVFAYMNVFKFRAHDGRRI